VALMKKTNGFVLRDEDRLVEPGIIDSLGILSLLEFIERKFSVQITDDDITAENFETPLAISRLIETKLSVLQEG